MTSRTSRTSRASRASRASRTATTPRPLATDTSERPGTALVTGATAGLGLAFARALAARGHDLVLVARDAERLGSVAGELAELYGTEPEVLTADLTRREDVDRLAQRLADPDRPVELLVNNAGFGLKHHFLDNTVDQEQAHLDVHVVAPLRLTHSALGAMAGRGHGSVLNVASVSAFLPRGTYAAAKAYVVAFSQWAATEYAPRGLRVMVVCPGFVRTEFHGRMDVGQDSVPRRMWLDADRVVHEALEDLARGRTLSVPSRRYKTVVALSKVLPRSVLQRSQGVGRR